MNPIDNPFAPGAGSPPPELVGRQPVIEAARILMARVLAGRAEKCLMLTGLRGVGKTVLLGEIAFLADSLGCRRVLLEALEDKPLGLLLAPHLRKLLLELDRLAGAGDKVKRGLSVLAGFIGSLKVSVGDLNFSLDLEPERGTADTGDLELDLPDLFVAVGRAALERQSALVLLLDEVQYLSRRELGALIMAMHRVQQERLPIALVGAGLPILPALAGDAKSYAERLFAFPRIGALQEAETHLALQSPARASGMEFTLEALQEIHRRTEGYPYFLQEWGYQCWNLADHSPIPPAVVAQATQRVMERLDENFFRVRFDRLNPAEKRMLRAMATFVTTVVRSGELAARMEVEPSRLSPVRAGLIRKGMIFSPGYGELSYTVPLFGPFMERMMPVFEPGI